MVKLFINGYGNIGRRLATAFNLDKQVNLIGIAKYSADERAKEAVSKGYKIFIPQSIEKDFNNRKLEFSGYIEEAIEQSDIVIDASKEGLGFENKQKYYVPMKKMAIFQGGEDREGRYSVADIIHNSRVNYDKVVDKSYVIQGSCNVSGLGRIMQPLIENFGDRIIRYDVSLIRRWADLEDSKDVKDSIEWDKNPHHQDDVKSFIPNANLFVESYKVPSRMMHLHQMSIRFKDKAPSKNKILDTFANEFGICILNSAKGTADVRKKALEMGFVHGDTNMVHIHQEVIRTQDDVLKILYSDDQTGMVIPENHLLVQSMVFKKPRRKALEYTNRIFQLNKKKKILEEEFK
ncbi:MAG TPA: type II glyceraldehyde-3-phosphate dehydrogenase [Nitrososphaeraceae archaeon]|nr:type II glyceraldehyde-3-phosphate dehydrogenase [Nitrososphaeraceae archaeon]